jgi:hypothetical protein
LDRKKAGFEDYDFLAKWRSPVRIIITNHNTMESGESRILGFLILKRGKVGFGKKFHF